MSKKVAIIGAIVSIVAILSYVVLTNNSTTTTSEDTLSTTAKSTVSSIDETQPIKTNDLTGQPVKSRDKNNKEIVIKLPEIPKVPEVPKVTVIMPIVHTTNSTSSVPPKPVNVINQLPTSSKPPQVTTPKTIQVETKKSEQENLIAGTNKSGRVPTYLRGTVDSLEETQKRLKDAGFNILSTTYLDVDNKRNLISIVFTHPLLEEVANKPSHGFFASLRLLINKETKEMTISNPLYFSKAFMQDTHNEKVALDVLQILNKTFHSLKDSKDRLKYTLLPTYCFMFGLPKYQDMITVAKADSSQKLLEQIKAYKGGQNLIFSQKLSDETYLIGVALSKKTTKFIDTVGKDNALLLPYPILIEKGTAKILNPKYYIAISYPMLKMSNFMKIATVPSAIEKDCTTMFQ
jgi:hypothetical protein